MLERHKKINYVPEQKAVSEISFLIQFRNESIGKKSWNTDRNFFLASGCAQKKEHSQAFRTKITKANLNDTSHFRK